MSQYCIIVGMGEGNGIAIARRFAQEGFAIAMVARNEQKLQSYQSTLQAENITSHYFLADAGNEAELNAALTTIQDQLGTPEVLIPSPANQP
ncbi:MAG TPA: SDR family NAD(P)-dependent oxidoreductase [Candidatus Obscuribacterales bacterium]